MSKPYEPVAHNSPAAIARFGAIALGQQEDKREIKDFQKLPSATSFIHKTLPAIHGEGGE